MEENQVYEIYYDGAGDFLEVIFGSPPENGGTEQIEPDVFVTKNTETNEVYSVGILGFKKKAYLLNKILLKLNKKLPKEIDISKSS